MHDAGGMHPDKSWRTHSLGGLDEGMRSRQTRPDEARGARGRGAWAECVLLLSSKYHTEDVGQGIEYCFCTKGYGLSTSLSDYCEGFSSRF